jgi:hypothetical protein
MKPDVGAPATAVVVALVRASSDIQYLRFRPYVRRNTNDQQSRSNMPVDRIFRHRRDPEVLWEVPQNLTGAILQAWLDQIADKRVVGLCSRIEMRTGKCAHALFMDFRCSKSPKSLIALEEACHHLGYSGWLLETDRSYHFFGDALVDDRSWLRFMGYWLLADHLIDGPFVGHCVIEGVSCLRVTAGPESSEPTIVKRV